MLFFALGVFDSWPAATRFETINGNASNTYCQAEKVMSG